MFMSNIKEIDSPELANWLEKEAGSFRMIDVREPAEIAQGTIPGAEAMPMSTLTEQSLREMDKSEKTVFICRSGARSGNVVAHLAQQGFDNAYNLRGGVMGWAQNGYQLGR